MINSTLKVHHLPGALGLPSVSPFCLKLDAWLRMIGIEHECLTVATPFAGPKGKTPWIEIGGNKLGNSTFIIATLTQHFGIDPDAELTTEQRGMAVAIQRLIDENLYWTIVHDRWMNEANWRTFRDVVLGGLSVPMRRILGPIAQRGVRGQLKGHGMGMHSADEVAMIGQSDVAALAAILEPKPWFFGGQPTSTDAVVYAQLVNNWQPPLESEVKRAIGEQPGLVSFLDRFAERFYP